MAPRWRHQGRAQAPHIDGLRKPLEHHLHQLVVGKGDISLTGSYLNWARSWI